MITTVARLVTQSLPDAAAIPLTRALAALTFPIEVTAEQQQAISRATKVYYGEGWRNVAWSWGTGPLVVLVHGWGGRAAQLAPLAEHLAKLGYQAVALDVTGHGESPKRYTHWEYFQRDIADLVRAVGHDVYAFVGHSAGGLSMMAARSLRGLSAQRYVCICAPSHPFPPIQVLRKKLAPREPVMESYKKFIARQFRSTWAELERGAAFAHAGPGMLLIYDKADRFVDHSEGDKLAAFCTGARLIKTQGYGHVGVVSAPEVLDAIGGFLTEPSIASAGTAVHA